MALFSFIREAFEHERKRSAAPTPPPVFIATPSASAPDDPTLRLMALAFTSSLSAANEISFEDAWWRLSQLPIHSIALLDSPSGWVSLAKLIEVSPRVTVH